MQSSEHEDYSPENVLRLMNQEDFGIHISLLNSGVDENSQKAKMSIVVESDLSAHTVQSILWGLLEQYEEVDLID